MTRTALARLYPGETPRRGEIRVELRQALDEGVAGVIVSVASLVTGAANEGSLNGLAGCFWSLSWNLLITGNRGTKASWSVRSHP